MRNAFLLLVVLICLVVYVRVQQPLTWNSWMVAAGANSLVVPTPADSGVAAAPAQPAPGEPDPAQPPPVRQVPVGGSIQEGNFASGGRYWQGDGRADPSGKGLVVQDYQHAYPPVPPNGNMTFGLAFPPGTGAVTLLTAYVTSR